MIEFWINGIKWTMFFVSPNSSHLYMGDGYTLGVTDLLSRRIFIANDLNDEKLDDVILHEICHCWLFSNGYETTISCEEMICQIVEQNSDEIQLLAERIIELL